MFRPLEATSAKELCQRKGLKKEENSLPGGQVQLKLFYPQPHAQKES